MNSNRQNYSAHISDDFTVWRTLFSRHAENLKGRAHPEYLSCLEKLGDVLNANKIPDFDELNKKLIAANGWSIVVMPDARCPVFKLELEYGLLPSYLHCIQQSAQ